MQKRNKRNLIYIIMAALLVITSGCGKADDPTAGAPAEEMQLVIGTDNAGTSQETPDGAAGIETQELPEEMGETFRLAEYPCPETFTVTEEMLTTSMVQKGNTYRLQNVISRALQGDEITLAYLGGSITKGAAATDEELCYAALTTQWWRDSFPQAQIQYINAGIGETDSYFGVHRVERDVLAHDPDVVIVEFSVNDGEEINKETYESLIRRILTEDEKTAVICLMLGTKTHSFSDEHFPIAYYYDLPIINVNGLMVNGLITWEQIGTEDGVHPSDEGHALFAGLIAEYCAEVAESVNENEAVDPYVFPEESLTPCRYMNAELVFAEDLKGLDLSGLVPEEDENTKIHGTGWTTEPGTVITIETDAKTFGIIFSEFDEEPEDGCAAYEVYVDGEYSDTIYGYNEDSTRVKDVYAECLRDDTVSHHIIELRPLAEAGNYFEIRALAVGE